MLFACAGLLLLAPESVASANEPGEVTAVSVLPGAGRAIVIIDVRGSVGVQDFTLASPPRLVIDVQGATLRAPEFAYDGVNRGGILNLRYAQFRPDVVRIVVELETLKDYELEYADEAIRITFGADRRFAAWSSTAPADYAAPATRGASVPLAPVALVPEPTAPPVLQSQQQLISASYDNAAIAEVMSGFAELSGRTIVLGKDVTGTVTAEVKNQPWDVAFRAILEAQGLAAEEDSFGIIRVDSRAALFARDSIEPLETRVYRLNYAKATSVAPILNGVKSSRGQVVADTGTNSVVVTDLVRNHRDINGLLRSLDVETPQVSIQAKIITVSRSDLKALGLTYDFGDDTRGTFYNTVVARPDPTTGVDTDGDGINDAFRPYEPEQIPQVVGLGGDAIAAVGNAGRPIAGAALDVVVTTALDRFNLTTFLRVLQEVSLADEQAEPLISTADNTRATILVGEETPVRNVDPGAQTALASSVELIPTGVRLEVTPHVTANRKVLLEVFAEKSSAEEVGTDLGFKFNRQNARSQVLVNDGQTAVIGGLTRTQVTVTKSGIPYLMDVPILGSLFSVSSRREERSDLLILVTPRIIDNPGGGQ
jgi:type IV pilus assembly protein PilQ